MNEYDPIGARSGEGMGTAGAAAKTGPVKKPSAAVPPRNVTTNNRLFRPASNSNSSYFNSKLSKIPIKMLFMLNFDLFVLNIFLSILHY